MQEGDVDWEDAAAVGAGTAGADRDLDGDDEDGGLDAYMAGAAASEQVTSAMMVQEPLQSRHIPCR